MAKLAKPFVLLVLFSGLFFSTPAFASCEYFGAAKAEDPRLIKTMNQFSKSCVASGLHPKTKKKKGLAQKKGANPTVLILMYCCEKATDRP